MTSSNVYDPNDTLKSVEMKPVVPPGGVIRIIESGVHVLIVQRSNTDLPWIYTGPDPV